MTAESTASITDRFPGGEPVVDTIIEPEGQALEVDNSWKDSIQPVDDPPNGKLPEATLGQIDLRHRRDKVE